MSVYNLRVGCVREVTITPSSEGELGCVIAWSSGAAAAEGSWRVLAVRIGGPAATAGIRPMRDHILGLKHETLAEPRGQPDIEYVFWNRDAFHDVLDSVAEDVANASHPSYQCARITATVYDRVENSVRQVTLITKDGSLGVEVGHGYIHQIPVSAQSPYPWLRVVTPADDVLGAGGAFRGGNGAPGAAAAAAAGSAAVGPAAVPNEVSASGFAAPGAFGGDAVAAATEQHQQYMQQQQQQQLQHVQQQQQHTLPPQHQHQYAPQQHQYAAVDAYGNPLHVPPTDVPASLAPPAAAPAGPPGAVAYESAPVAPAPAAPATGPPPAAPAAAAAPAGGLPAIPGLPPGITPEQLQLWAMQYQQHQQQQLQQQQQQQQQPQQQLYVPDGASAGVAGGVGAGNAHPGVLPPSVAGHVGPHGVAFGVAQGAAPPVPHAPHAAPPQGAYSGVGVPAAAGGMYGAAHTGAPATHAFAPPNAPPGFAVPYAPGSVGGVGAAGAPGGALLPLPPRGDVPGTLPLPPRA